MDQLYQVHEAVSFLQLANRATCLSHYTVTVDYVIRDMRKVLRTCGALERVLMLRGVVETS